MTVVAERDTGGRETSRLNICFQNPPSACPMCFVFQASLVCLPVPPTAEATRRTRARCPCPAPLLATAETAMETVTTTRRSGPSHLCHRLIGATVELLIISLLSDGKEVKIPASKPTGRNRRGPQAQGRTSRTQSHKSRETWKPESRTNSYELASIASASKQLRRASKAQQ